MTRGGTLTSDRSSDGESGIGEVGSRLDPRVGGDSSVGGEADGGIGVGGGSEGGG